MVTTVAFMTLSIPVFMLAFTIIVMENLPFAGQDARCTHKTRFAGPSDSSELRPENHRQMHAAAEIQDVSSTRIVLKFL